MKKIIGLAAVATLGVAGAAHADVTINFSEFVQAGGFVELQFDVDELTGNLTGVSGDFETYAPGENFTYANDLMVLAVIGNDLANDDYALQVGGFSNFGALDRYGWQGAEGNNANAGAWINETINLNAPLDVSGLSFWLGNGYGSGGNGYWEGSITLHGVSLVPAPGALALLGVAGLAGRSRRRS